MIRNLLLFSLIVLSGCAVDRIDGVNRQSASMTCNGISTEAESLSVEINYCASDADCAQTGLATPWNYCLNNITTYNHAEYAKLASLRDLLSQLKAKKCTFTQYYSCAPGLDTGKVQCLSGICELQRLPLPGL